MQGHLESVKEELHQTREDLQQSKEKLVEKEDGFRKKLLESDAEIESSRKTIAELQVRVAIVYGECLIWAPRCTGICLWYFQEDRVFSGRNTFLSVVWQEDPLKAQLNIKFLIPCASRRKVLENIPSFVNETLIYL